MARARIIGPGFFTNELLAELPFEGRLLFAGLWTLADREGRLEDRPKRIGVQVFPFDRVDVEALLGQLEARGFILRYEADGTAVIQIAKFAEHQTPHIREKASNLPSPEKAVQSRGSASPRSPVSVPVLDPVPVPVNSSATLTRPEPLAVLEFPVVGKGAKSWGLSEAQVAEWTRLYPGLDVETEARKALAWVLADLGRRKTDRGMPKFLVNWLNRSTDRGSGQGVRPPRRALPTADAYEWTCHHEPHCSNRTTCQVVSMRPVKAS